MFAAGSGEIAVLGPMQIRPRIQRGYVVRRLGRNLLTKLFIFLAHKFPSGRRARKPLRRCFPGFGKTHLRGVLRWNEKAPNMVHSTRSVCGNSFQVNA
jgi:hypothetical protein